MSDTPRTTKAILAMCESLSNEPLIKESRALERELYSALQFADRHASQARLLKLKLDDLACPAQTIEKLQQENRRLDEQCVTQFRIMSKMISHQAGVPITPHFAIEYVKRCKAQDSSDNPTGPDFVGVMEQLLADQNRVGSGALDGKQDSRPLDDPEQCL